MSSLANYQDDRFQASLRSLQAYATGGRLDKAMDCALDLVRCGAVPTFVPFLSGLFRLRGQPYGLIEHFAFEPLFASVTAPSLVCKTGRQIGKCRPLTADETVMAANGRPLKPDDLSVGTELITVTDRLRWATGRVRAIHKKPAEPIVRIRTRTGADVRFSHGHLLRTYAGFKTVETLTVGDRIAAIAVGGRFENRPADRNRVILTAYMIGDGSLRQPGPTFTSVVGRHSLSEFVDVANAADPNRPVRTTVRPGTSVATVHVKSDHLAGGWFRQDGLYGKYAWEKSVPAWVFSLSRDDTCLFLSRLWSTDGSVKKFGRVVDISYATTSKQLAVDVRALLTKLGIRSTVRVKKSGYKKDGVYRPCRDCHIVRVETRDGFDRFMREIQVPDKPAFDLPSSVELNNRDTLPDEAGDDVARIVGDRKWKHTDSLFASGLAVSPKYALSRPKARRYLESFRKAESADLKAYRRFDDSLNGDVFWDEIISIDEQPSEPVWDVEMDRYHTYVVDGLVSHNTQSMCTSAALRATLIPNYRIMFVTPLFTQVQRISNDVMRPLMNESPVGRLMTDTRVEASVLRRTFYNNSRIEFTFASLSADRVRGSANDELDIDESYRGDTTYVTTRRGQLLLKEVPVGDEILSFTENGKLVWRKVLTNSYHGRRRCFRLITASGKTIDATSDSYMALPAGWVRVSSLVERIDQWHRDQRETDDCQEPAAIGAAVHERARTDVTGNSTGGRVCSTSRVLPGQSQPEAGRISLDQVHRLARVRYRKSVDLAEEQTRVLVGQVLHCDGSGVSLLANPVLSEQHKSRYRLLAETDRFYRLFGSGSVVDSRRRVETGVRSITEHYDQHAFVLDTRSGDALSVDDRSRLSVSGLLPVQKPEKTDDAISSRLQPETDDRSIAAHSTEHAVQAESRTGSREYGKTEAVRRRVSEKESREMPPVHGELPSQEESENCLAYDRLVRIEDIGEHDVYDIEVEDTHCFVANGLAVSNCQDMHPDHFPVILETISASKDYGLVRKFGTPKTPENTIEGEWRTSSQGVWVIPCPACRKSNYACLSHDLERMIGPYRPDIGPNRPGTVCANPKCSRPIWPHLGHYEHRYPERRDSRLGYHIPQPVMPLHYASARKWRELHHKREGVNFFTPAKYQNEVLGESAGEGLQLITREQLQAACDPARVNRPKDPKSCAVGLNKYKYVVMAVDWGGGGESGTSLTVPVIMGFTHAGGIEVIYATRLYTPNDHLAEAAQLLRLYKLLGCRFMVHDFTGAGSVRETVMTSAGVDRRELIPIEYVGGGQMSLMVPVKPTTQKLRRYYRLNKPRSLLYTCAAIRQLKIKFFAWDNKGLEDPGLVSDFLALYEERIERKSGSNVYLIARNQAQTDDFAQAVNIGACALWYLTKSWPKFTIDPKFDLTDEQKEYLEPARPWEEADDPGNVLEDLG